MPTTEKKHDSRAQIVELRDVKKTYGSGETAVTPLEGLALDVAEGEFVALMGPSGSGKSTLLNLLCGIDTPTAGTVKVAGETVNSLSRSELARWRNRHVGVIFQNYHLVPVLTAYENVELPLLLRGLSRAERRKRVDIALAAVGLVERGHHTPAQLSGGQQQRVAIARAFVTDPDVIIADEPTGNLDRESARATMALLTRLNQEFNKSLIMVTHDAEAALNASRTLWLRDGILHDTAPKAPTRATTSEPQEASS